MKKPEYKHPKINFLIFDDLVGDASAFKKGHSAITHLCIHHRHLQCNLIFTTQYTTSNKKKLRHVYYI
jgi:hypothetical protein